MDQREKFCNTSLFTVFTKILLPDSVVVPDPDPLGFGIICYPDPKLMSGPALISAPDPKLLR